MRGALLPLVLLLMAAVFSGAQAQPWPKIAISLIGSMDVEEGKPLKLKISRTGALSSPLKDIVIYFAQIGAYGRDPSSGRPIHYIRPEQLGPRCSFFPQDVSQSCFTIPAGEASITVNVPTYATTSFEKDAQIGFFIRGGYPQYVNMNHYRYKEPRQLYATVRDGPDATPDVRVTLSTPDTRAAEGDSTDTATLRLYLSGAGEERGMIAGESLRVPLVFSGGQPGTDFTLSLSGSPVGVTFDPETSTVIFTGPARGTSAAVATLTLTASDDSDANDGTVSVSIPQRSNRGAPRLTASGIPGTATGIRSGDGRILLVDDDAPPPKPVVGIAGGPAVTEGGKASFTVSASPAPSAPLEVALTVAQSGDVAASGATGPRTVTVPVGGSVTVEVATADDSADEPDGSVSVTVEAGAGYTVASSQASTTVAVRDNDATAVSLAAPAGDIAEAGGTKVLTVTLGRALAQGEELSVPLVFGGAAGRGADYRSACANAVGIACANLDSGNAAVTFTGGAQAARTATITLTATADALAEGAGETVTVRLGRLAAKGLGGGAQGTGSVAFRILEPTTPGVSVSTGALSLAESGSAGSYTVALDSAPTTDVTVTATSGDAAKVRVHGPGGTAGASAALVFTPSSWGAQTVTVTPQDDGDASDESVTVSHSVSNTGGYAGVTAPSVTVSVDDDETPVVAFASASSSAGEAAGTRDVAINLDPVPAAGILLAYGVSGTASAGSGHDFIITNYGTVSVPSGAATATIPVTIKDDSIEENSETVVLTLSDGVDYTLGTVKTHTLTITDNDTPLDPEVSVSAAGAVTEGGKASFTVSASPAPSAPLGVALTVAQSGDVAASGETGARTVTVPVGGSVTVEVATADDSADEPDGSVSVTVKAGAGYTVASGQASATVEVRDNDDAPSRPVSSCVSDELMATAERLYEHNRNRPPEYAENWFSVLLAFGARSASEWTADDRTISPMASASARQRGWRRFAAALECLEDAAPVVVPVVRIAAGAAVTEGGAATFTLSASPAPSAAIAVEVEVADSGDFAVGGQTGVRTVTVGTDGTGSLTVATVNDSADEANGTLVATVRSGDGYVPHGSAGAAEVAVSDDDDPAPSAPVVSIAGGLAVTEGGNASFTLSAAPAPASNLAVTVDIGGAVAPSALGARTVTLPGGTGSKTFTIATVDDAADGPGGSVTATVVAKDGYTPGDAASATVAVTDDDATGVRLSAATGDLPEASGRKVLTIALGRALVEGERLSVPLLLGGGATLGSDYTLSAPAPRPLGLSYADLAGPGAPTLTFTGPSASSATVILTATADSAAEGESETVTVGLGTFGVAGLGGGAEGSGTVSFAILEPPPEVAIAAKTASVTEGADAAFTVTASRAPAADLTVRLTVSESDGSDFVAAAHESAATVTIPKGKTEAAFTVATVNDAADEPDGSVTVTLAAAGGYTVAAPPGNAASVAVSDDDAASTVPTLSVADATAHENEGVMWFTVRLSGKSEKWITVRYRTRESTPISAQENRDYLDTGWFKNHRSEVTFPPGRIEKRFYVWLFNDNHAEDPETFEVVLHSPSAGVGIADGVAVGTIVNSDPMPAAWLARFGRTVAEQALDGIAGRMAAPRTPGAHGTVAGQAISLNPGSGSFGSGSGAGEAGSGGPGGPANGIAAMDNPSRSGLWAQSSIARAFGAGHDGFAGHSGRFGAGGLGTAHGFGSSSGQSRTMTVQEALLGSSFTATGETDSSGGSLAFWGRAAQGSFDGREGAFSLDGEATTAMLGADYARGNWLVGLALMQSAGEGGYRDTKPKSRAMSQLCEENDNSDMDEDRVVLCKEAIREGDGSVEASLTAAVPYAALQASERLKLWGAAGYGTGEVTLKPQVGGSYRADIDWTMAAAGLRGDVIAPPKEGSGPALAVTSDALWARTTSDKTRDLAASESDVTRLRLGLEGSYRVALEEGGHLTPKLEVGARHDGGDAETGFGVELGGGIAWVDPSLGLSLDLSGRTLIAHGNDDLEDRGYSASLAYDPAPATKRGPSLTLIQDWGGRAQGGLDALFAPNPLEDRTGSGEAASRWAMEAAYGLPVLGGRFTGSPHVGFGLATAARDYTIGWRLTPEAASAPDLSFGLKAVRRESDAAAAEHSVGFEITARW